MFSLLRKENDSGEIMKNAVCPFPLIMAMLLLAPGSGCRSSGPPQEIGPVSGNFNQGNSPGRIICAAPSITEIVYALGCGDRVVGVSDFSVHPPPATSKPRIGGFINPNLERIISLKPDLVITQGDHDSLHALERELGIKRLSVKIDSLSDLKQAVRILGDRLDRGAEARSLVLELENDLRRIQEKTHDLPRPKVFLSLGHTPGDLTGLMTSGSGTFLNELIGIAGGINIFGDIRSLYPKISKEALILHNPDIILEICPEGISPGSRKLLHQDWDRFVSLHRRKPIDIHFISDDYLLIPGLRLPLAARKFAHVFHGERFPEDP